MTLPLASVIVVVGLSAWWSSWGEPTAITHSSPTDATFLDRDRPVLVLVRGWLWDPSSRRNSPDLTKFPIKLRSKMLETSGVEPQVVQYRWSRIPKDLAMESDRFTLWARELTRNSRKGCVSFMGHSAGAAMIFKAAAEGIPMGYMGTLGLPTVGAAKPRSVTTWANFYTDTHVDDIAGVLWADKMRADINYNLRMRHGEFWESAAAVEITARQMADAWAGCRGRSVT